MTANYKELQVHTQSARSETCESRTVFMWLVFCAANASGPYSDVELHCHMKSMVTNDDEIDKLPQ